MLNDVDHQNDRRIGKVNVMGQKVGSMESNSSLALWRKLKQYCARNRVGRSTEVISDYGGSPESALEDQLSPAKSQIDNKIVIPNVRYSEWPLQSLAKNETAVSIEEFSPLKEVGLVV